jgi:hypothetical protein
MSSVVLVFSTHLCELCPSDLLSGTYKRSPPFPLPYVKVLYSIHMQCVAGRRWVVLSPVGDHI